jgi:uncharacterized RmlC-like cupin family protein
MPVSIEIVRASPDLAGAGKPFGGQSVFDSAEAHVGLSRLSPGAVTHWHHHAARIFFGYLVEGSLSFEYGSRGATSARVAAGDFFRISPGLVHRDVNAGPERALVATVSVGGGPLSVPVDGPEP